MQISQQRILPYRRIVRIGIHPPREMRRDIPCARTFHGCEDELRALRVMLIEHAPSIFAPFVSSRGFTKIRAAAERFVQDEPGMLDALLVRSGFKRAHAMGPMADDIEPKLACLI